MFARGGAGLERGGAGLELGGAGAPSPGHEQAVPNEASAAIHPVADELPQRPTCNHLCPFAFTAGVGKTRHREPTTPVVTILALVVGDERTLTALRKQRAGCAASTPEMANNVATTLMEAKVRRRTHTKEPLLT